MDSQANSLINPDARTGLASPVPGATAAAALPEQAAPARTSGSAVSRNAFPASRG